MKFLFCLLLGIGIAGYSNLLACLYSVSNPKNNPVLKNSVLISAHKRKVMICSAVEFLGFIGASVMCLIYPGLIV